MDTTPAPRRPGPVLLLAVAAVLAVSGCSILTPDEAIADAETQWDALPADAREALGVGDADGSPWGNVAENWSIEASVDLSGEAEPGVLGSLVTSRCHAVVDALAGTDVTAYGTFPLTPGLVDADHATCARGLGLGSWTVTAGVEDSAGRALDAGDLQLGTAGATGADLFALTLDLTDATLSTSSDDPPWTVVPTTVDPAAFDAALAAVSAPLPLEPVLVDAGWTTSVIAVPAGTAVSAVALCRATGQGESVAVESPDDWGLVSRISWSGATVDPEEAGPMQADCGSGPASGALLPTLRFTPTGGVPTDVVVLDVTDTFPGTDPALLVAAR